MRRRVAAALLAVTVMCAGTTLVAHAADGSAAVVVVPTPSLSCPSPDGGGLPGLGDVINHVPIIGTVSQLAQDVGKMVSTVLGWLGDPGNMAHDVVGWFTWHLLGWNPDHPDCYVPTSGYGFFRSVITGDVHLDASSAYHDAYSSLALGSMVVVLLAGVGRVVRAASGPRREWSAALVDVLPRVVAGLAGVELGFAALSLVLPFCSAAGMAVFKAFAAVAGVPQSQISDPLSFFLFGGLGHLAGLGLVELILAPILLFLLLRTLFLLIARFLIVSFLVAFTPLVIAIAVFDHRARAVQWWATMMGGAALIPLVSGGMIGLTVGLSLRFAQGDQSTSSIIGGPLVGTIMVIGGLWLTGKALRALLFEPNRQGGILTVLRYAAEMAIVLPMMAAGLATVVPGRGGRVLGALGSRGAMGGGILAANKVRQTEGAKKAKPVFDAATTFAEFKTSPEGQALARAATKNVLPDESTADERWSFMETHAAMQDAVNDIRASVTATATREGKPGIEPHQRDAFLTAARKLPRRDGQESAPGGPGDEGSAQ